MSNDETVRDLKALTKDEMQKQAAQAIEDPAFTRWQDDAYDRDRDARLIHGT